MRPRRIPPARLLIALALALSLIPLSGCGVVEERRARQTVEEYIELLPAVYARSEPGLLAEVATDAEQNRVLMYLLYMKQREEGLDTRLLGFEVTGSEILDEEGRALVTTSEDWEYRLLDTQTGESKGGSRTTHYDSTYSLKLVDGAWMVSDVDVRQRPGSAGETGSAGGK